MAPPRREEKLGEMTWEGKRTSLSDEREGADALDIDPCSRQSSESMYAESELEKTR